MAAYNLGDLHLRHLLVVQAISEEGSFSAAADRMGCSQAALSQQLAAVEAILGARLIERMRGKRKVETTDAGRLLLRHAETVIGRLQALHADLTAFGEGKAGTIRLGTFESSGAIILPPVLRQFRKQWPQVEIQLTEMQRDDELVTLLEAGTLDICFAILPLPGGPFQSERLVEDPYILVANDDSLELSGERPFTILKLGNVPLVTFGDSRSVEQIETFLREKGINLNIVFRSNYNGMVQGLATGGGVAALSTLMTTNFYSLEAKHVCRLNELPPRQIGLAWHRDRFQPNAVKAFVETARSVCEDLREANEQALEKL